MPHLEPTYLRYIYDGLIKGSIHPENAAELPEGLIGLYDELFNSALNVSKRRNEKLLFDLFSLVKGPVSDDEMIRLSGGELTSSDFSHFIQNNSKFLNVTVDGRYQLYHDRLRLYLLQRMTKSTILELTRTFINVLIKVNKSDDPLLPYRVRYLAEHIYSVSEYSRNNWNSNFINKVLLSQAYENAGEAFVVNFNADIRKLIKLDGYYHESRNILEIASHWRKLFQFTTEIISQQSKKIFDGKVVDHYISSLRLLNQPDTIFEHFIWTLLILLSDKSIEEKLIDSYCQKFELIEDLIPDSFKWNLNSSLSERTLLKVAHYLHHRQVSPKFIYDKGDFSIMCILDFLGEDAFSGDPSLLLTIIKDYDSVKKSKILFALYNMLRLSGANNRLLNVVENQIESCEEKLKLLIIKKGLIRISQSEIELLEQIALSDRLPLILELMESVSSLDEKSIVAYFNSIRINFKELNNEDFSDLTGQEKNLKEDQYIQEEIAFNNNYIKLLRYFKKSFLAVVEQNAELIEKIRNGGYKAESSLSFLEIIQDLDDEEIGNIAKNVNRRIPRIRPGALNYGQFIIDNQLDLAEEYINSKLNRKAVSTLNSAEKLILSSQDPHKRDQQNLRLLRLNRSLNRVGVCRRILKKIVLDDYKILALEEVLRLDYNNSYSFLSKNVHSRRQQIWLTKKRLNSIDFDRDNNIKNEVYLNYLALESKPDRRVTLKNIGSPIHFEKKSEWKTNPYLRPSGDSFKVITDELLRRNEKTLPPFVDYRLNEDHSRISEMTIYENYLTQLLMQQREVSVEVALPSILETNKVKVDAFRRLINSVESNSLHDFENYLNRIENISDFNLSTLISKIRNSKFSAKFCEILISNFGLEMVRRCYVNQLKIEFFEFGEVANCHETAFFLSESLDDAELLMCYIK